MSDPKSLGKYEITGVLGKGAMGVVYSGVDKTFQRRRDVAIKTIRKSQLTDLEMADEYARRFEREAEIGFQLNHPNIVRVFEYSVEGDISYLVMELVRGEELKHYFDQGNYFNLGVAVRLMTELLEALDHAHKHGIVHRDIKPANILIEAQGRLKLTDFGVARVSDAAEGTRTGTKVGTYSYMAPEQIQGLAINQRADIFAAGIVLYQFLTHQKPFTGSEWELQNKIVHELARPPSSIRSDVPPIFDAIVAKALAKLPGDRYTNAQEFADALKHALAEISKQTSVGDANAADDETTMFAPQGSIGSGAKRTASGGLAESSSGSSQASQSGIENVSKPSGVGGVTGPSGASGGKAPSEEAEIEFWRSIKDSTDPEDYEFYVIKFPYGTYVDLARRRIAKYGGSSPQESSGVTDAEKAAEQAKEAEEERLAAERAKKAEEERLVAEKARKAEEERLAAEKAKKAEEERLAVEKAKKVEEERLAVEKARNAEQERLAAEKARKAEEERLAAERAKKVEEERLAAEKAKKVEEERLAAEKARRAEEARLAAERAQKAEQERIAAKKAEQERIAAAKAKKAEEERLAAESAKKAKEERIAAALARHAEKVGIVSLTADAASNEGAAAIVAESLQDARMPPSRTAGGTVEPAKKGLPIVPLVIAAVVVIAGIGYFEFAGRKAPESGDQVTSPPAAAPAAKDIEAQKRANEEAAAQAKKAEDDRLAQQAKEAEEQARAKEEAAALAKQAEEARQKTAAQTKKAEEAKTEKAARDRIAAEKAERDRIAADKAEQDRIAADKAEQDRFAADRAERDRKAARKAEEDRNATAQAKKAEEDRLAAARKKAEEDRPKPMDGPAAKKLCEQLKQERPINIKAAASACCQAIKLGEVVTAIGRCD